MILSQRQKINVPAKPPLRGVINMAGRRAKIEVQGLTSAEHTAPNALQPNGERGLADALRDPQAFARAIEAERPGFFKQLAIGAGLGLGAIVFVPGLFKLAALIGIAGYVGLRVRKVFRFDPIQVCLDMIGAKEKVIGTMRVHVEGLRRQMMANELEIVRINEAFGARFAEMTHLVRDQQRPRTDPDVRALEQVLTQPFGQRRQLESHVKTQRAEIHLTEERIALLEQNAQGLQTVKVILEQEQAAQRSRDEVIRAQKEVPTLSSHDPEAISRQAAEMAAGQRAQVDDLFKEISRDGGPRLPEGVGGEDSDLFKQAKGDGL